jgi:hypothetical protein
MKFVTRSQNSNHSALVEETESKSNLFLPTTSFFQLFPLLHFIPSTTWDLSCSAQTSWKMLQRSPTSAFLLLALYFLLFSFFLSFLHFYLILQSKIMMDSQDGLFSTLHSFWLLLDFTSSQFKKDFVTIQGTLHHPDCTSQPVSKLTLTLFKFIILIFSSLVKLIKYHHKCHYWNLPHNSCYLASICSQN